MDSKIPHLLHPLLQDLARLFEEQMPGRVEALYLEGSVALGAFNPRLSDIDLVAFLNEKANRGDYERLARLHTVIGKRYPAWKISAMYFPWDDLGCTGRLQPFPNYHDGKLYWEDRFPLAPVTWWILKNRGIAVFGPPVESLNLMIDMDQLLKGQRENLNTYWGSWTRQPRRVLTLLTDWGIEWTVLGVLRQFYTIHERRITSKTGAGEYGMVHLPARWHAIIREAIALRQEPRHFYFRSRLNRALQAYRFLKYVIVSCNQS